MTRQDRIEAAVRDCNVVAETGDRISGSEVVWIPKHEWDDVRAALAEPYVCWRCEIIERSGNSWRSGHPGHVEGPGGIRCSRETG